MHDDLPILFFDHPLPDAYRDLVDGRAVAVGPDDTDLGTAHAVLAGAKRAWNAEAFALGSSLKVISRIGIGYDNVDVPAAAAAGVIVCNAPDAPSVSTAEHTLMLMLAVVKNLPAQTERARQGLAGATTGSALELDGTVLGLVGYGRIARRVGAAARAMGMSVLAYDPYLTEADGCELVGLDRVFAESDVISLHAPAVAETRHMVNATSLEAMKHGAYIVNCARGGLVDQEALLAALDSGQVGGAGLDVTDPEPLPVGHPLLEHPNVIVTPHVASATVAGRRRLYAHAIDNALNVLAGRPATIVAPPG
ncbi:MAG TPA: NAD(P)-dependent oxidoreductase [Ilumatobacteraceae bacterium]|nr:NAD(P)-dependent oxidoreductase [Ilumatobacteraceae bacterium]